MRKQFFNQLEIEMEKNPKIVFLTGDLGFGLIEPIQNKYPDRFYNMGVAEQLMIGVAANFARNGLIPITYTISSFYLRPFEWIRNYLEKENIPVKMVGAGRNRDYLKEGFTHHSEDLGAHFDVLKNVNQFWPETEKEMLDILPEFLNNKRPSYLSLSK